MERFITSDKIFHHLDRVALWKKGRVVRPVTIELHPSNRCNNRCYYCIASEIMDQKEMSLPELKAAIRKIRALGAKGLIFSGGGEPLCNRHALKAVEYAQRAKLSVGFITNGLLVREETAKVLTACCEWVRVSLDSLNHATYKKIRGADGIAAAQKGLTRLLDARQESGSQCVIGVQMVVNKYNFSEIYEFVKLAEQRFPGIDYIQVRPLELFAKDEPYSGEEAVMIKKQIELVQNSPLLKKTILSSKWDLVFGERTYGFSACHCYGMIGAVDAHGDIYICCQLVRRPEFKYGHVLTDSVRGLLRQREETAEKTIRHSVRDCCPINCRGSAINRRLEGLLQEREHENFL